MRFIGAGGVWARERVREVIAFQLRHLEQHGFGWHAALERDSGDCVGYMGLNFLGEGTEGLAADEYEIGWWVAPEHWGRATRRRERGRSAATRSTRRRAQPRGPHPPRERRLDQGGRPPRHDARARHHRQRRGALLGLSARPLPARVVSPSQRRSEAMSSCVPEPDGI